MKRIISTMLALGMILSSAGAFAEEMTVDEAVEYALEHSVEFAKNKAETEANKYSAMDMKATQKSLMKNPFLEVNSFETYLSLKGYYTKAAELALTVAQRAAEDLVQTTENNVKNDFYTYLNSLRSVETARENLSISRDRLEAARVRMESGVLSKLDFQSFELACEGAEISFNQAERTAGYNLKKLKNTINYTGEDELVPVGSFVYSPTEPVAPEIASEKLKSCNTYLNLQNNFELAELRWYMASKHYSGNMNAYKVEKGTYEKAVAEFEINKKQLELNIENMYNSLITLGEQIEYTSRYVTYLRQVADAMYMRYEMGLVTASDYREAQQEYFKMQNDLNELELTYLVTNMNYESLFNNSMEDGTNE